MDTESELPERILRLAGGDTTLARRVATLQRFARAVRGSSYYVTHACNIRCEGCWFFAYEYDQAPEQREAAAWREFVAREAARGVTAATLYGGEPTLFVDRVAMFREKMPYTTVVTNGLRPLPRAGFEDVAVAISLFGGGAMDDRLRAIRPSGTRFEGLFETALRNYRDDPRAGFIFALHDEGLGNVEPTVRRIRDNGNHVVFSYYRSHGALLDPRRAAREARTQRLLDEALRVSAAYPGTVRQHAYLTTAALTGKTHWAQWGFDVCPTVSHAHAAYAQRAQTGHPSLARYNTFTASHQVALCTLSGNCGECRDQSAMSSWMQVSARHFADTPARVALWVEIVETILSGLIWSPYYPARRPARRAGPNETEASL